MKLIALFLLLTLFSVPGFTEGIPDHDRRNTSIRHTDMHYEFGDYGSLAEWKQRADHLRRQVQFSAGLMPWPEKTPLHAEVFDKTEHEDYTIEKVILETYPGFFLGGNLFRPVGKPGPYPAVVSPHGHWRFGRLENQQLNSTIGRGITLARQGYIVLNYDMVGYNDTAAHIAHHQDWGRRAELWGVGILGLQLWNSIRVTDFLLSLPNVDTKRVAATGASGGGSQVFLQTAVDDRIHYAAPVNMISAHMQGGDWCENAPNLRIDTNNMEIGALTAPRPMLMVSATGDWTKNTPREEFPAIQKIYNLYGAEDGVEEAQFDSPHNYHQDSREAMYKFFGKKVLGDFDASHFKEKGFRVDQLGRLMAYWGREAPKTPKDLDTFISERIAASEKYLQALKPTDQASLDKARSLFREWLSLATMAESPAPEKVQSEVADTMRSGEVLLIGRADKGDRVPAVLLRPRRTRAWVNPTLIVHPEGTSWVLSSSESLDGLVRGFLKRGGVVAGIDAFQTGRAREERDESEITDERRRHMTTFNRTDTANRIQDVLTAISYFRARLETSNINLLCPGEAGAWCFFARALAGEGIRLIADLGAFENYDDDEIEKKLFIPHIRRAGDFRGASLLQAPGKTLLYNTAATFPREWIQDAFQAAEAEPNLDLRSEAVSDEELIDSLTPRRRPRR